MAYSSVTYTANSSANGGKDYTYSFGAVSHDTDNIKVSIGGTALTSSQYSVVQGTVTLSTVPGAGSAPFNAALSSTNVLKLSRFTNRTSAEVVFSANSVIQDEDLNTATDQGRFLALEAVDRSNESIAIDETDSTRYNVQIDSQDKRIFGVSSPNLPNEAVNKSYADGVISTAEGHANSASSSASTASGHATTASEWATKSVSSGQVASTDYSSKAYAQDETTGTDTTGGSAKGWAQTAKNTQVPGAATSDRSAKHYAEIASDHATTSASNKERFLTANSSDPTTRDPNGSGDPLQTGDLYFNTTQNKMKVRNDATPPAWQDTSSSIEGVAHITEYNGSQATNNKWFALTHDVGLQIVWLNGVRQVQGSDYHSTNANDSTANMTTGTASHIYFVSNVASTDVISAMAFGQVDSTAVVAKSGGTFTGNITVPTPTASGHAVTKDYVDNNTGAANEIELSNAVTLPAETITYQKIYLGNTFTVGGNLTVNGNLVLGKIIADSTGQTLSGSGYTITGTGQITMNATLV